MHVEVQSITPPLPNRSRSAVATAKITIHCVVDHAFTVDDVTIMRTDAGDLWVAMPRRKTPGGTYVPFISLSVKMKRAIDDVVLPGAEKWLAAQSASAQPFDGGAR
jgi:DNA-binding cell septation regulator SpoVG